MSETTGHTLEAIQRSGNQATRPQQKLLSTLKARFVPGARKGAHSSAIELDEAVPGRRLSGATVERRASARAQRRPSDLRHPLPSSSTLATDTSVFDNDASDIETDNIKDEARPGSLNVPTLS